MQWLLDLSIWEAILISVKIGIIAFGFFIAICILKAAYDVWMGPDHREGK